jgi:hypothetical protein
MSQHTAYQKGARLDKTKLKREKFFLGQEHGVGVYVNIRGLTAPEAEEHVKRIKDLSDASVSEADRKAAGYFLLASCLVADDGSQMFDDAEDVEKNFDVSSADFVKIIGVMNRMSGFDKGREGN